jgi:hypothetical protein
MILAAAARDGVASGPLLAAGGLSRDLLAAFTLLGRRHAGAGFVPREVRFARPIPEDTSEHERIFCAPLRFGAPGDVLVSMRRGSGHGCGRRIRRCGGCSRRGGMATAGCAGWTS